MASLTEQDFRLEAETTGENDATPPQITVVLNWHSELLERVPVPYATRTGF